MTENGGDEGLVGMKQIEILKNIETANTGSDHAPRAEIPQGKASLQTAPDSSS